MVRFCSYKIGESAGAFGDIKIRTASMVKSQLYYLIIHSRFQGTPITQRLYSIQTLIVHINLQDLKHYNITTLRLWPYDQIYYQPSERIFDNLQRN